MGYSAVAEVRQGKFFDVALEAGSAAEAQKTLQEIAEKVLANPVIESFRVQLEVA